MKSSLKISWGVLGMAALLAAGCNDDTIAPVAEPPVTEEFTIPEADLYSGSRGLVVDARAFAQKGYRPTAVQISFADLPELDAELEVDPVTNIAVFRVENDSLSESQIATLDAGRVQTTIVVFGEPASGTGFALASGGAPARIPPGSTELGRAEGGQSLDASNRPIRVRNTSLAEIPPPVVLASALAYTVVPAGTADVITRVNTNCSNCIETRPWQYFEGASPATDTYAGRQRDRQGFYFVPSGSSPGLYHIVNRSEPGLGEFGFIVDTTPSPELNFGGDTIPLPPEGPAEFAVVQSPDSRVQIRDEESGLFLEAPSGGRWTLGDNGADFRLLAPKADLSVVNIGTSFNQPVLPPAEIVFASQSVIRNCSLAVVEETIGRTETRDITRSHATTEAFQIFSDSSFSFQHRLALEVERKFSTPGGTGFEGTDVATVAGNWQDQYTTSNTEGNERVTQSDTTETIEITRERVAIVPERSAVRIVDVVRTVKNLVIPWTQTLRIRARTRDTREVLTGEEILSILRFNEVRAVALRVEDSYLDVTLRGSTTADRFYKTEINATNIPNGCD